MTEMDRAARQMITTFVHFSTGSLLAIVASSVLQNVQSGCVKNGFDLTFQGSCNYSIILSKFEEVFNNPVNRADGCNSTAEEELKMLLGGGDNDATIKSICTTTCPSAVICTTYKALRCAQHNIFVSNRLNRSQAR
mmetsp:Transcript_27866/g.28267  ORF Transcript_27866/g.28267 Transcript_27866/m.28267 type:complete len:136 (+) Transcript_27866:9-416(+)